VGVACELYLNYNTVRGEERKEKRERRRERREERDGGRGGHKRLHTFQ
jgi:hypothetical protein